MKKNKRNWRKKGQKYAPGQEIQEWGLKNGKDEGQGPGGGRDHTPEEGGRSLEADLGLETDLENLQGKGLPPKTG